MTKSLLFALALLATISTTATTTMTVNNVSAEKCEDIKGVEKWDAEGHGDNDPSSKEFKEMLSEIAIFNCSDVSFYNVCCAH